ncbi:hypothetical protein VE03_04912 [Pseudogymnoascus sp. 23342-1-I1]|nr:hypothetical protein VE03_04912 [Pseudogymnoascus sp. 23342-1-I1]
MSQAARELKIYRKDAKSNHNLLTPAEREKLIAPFLPEPPSRSKSGNGESDERTVRSKQPRPIIGVRKFLKHQLHVLVFAIIHTIFSIYIRFRQAYHTVRDRTFAVLYYHHRTPGLIQKDVKGLNRLPEHLSVILKLEEGKGGAALETLLDEVAEVCAWCACAGIPMLSIYERTGVLKGYIPTTHRAVTRKLASYFGRQHPALSIRAPHIPSMESSPTTPPTDADVPVSLGQLSVLLISEEDGEDSIVDLTKTLTEMSQRSKITPKDITIDLVDAELSESVMSGPELLILFGPTIELDGYPPWQISLTEIYNVQDNQGVGYQVFLRALYNYANAQMRFGR